MNNQPTEPDIKHPKVNHHYIGETLHETFDEDVFTKESVIQYLIHIEDELRECDGLVMTEPRLAKLKQLVSDTLTRHGEY